MEVPVSAVPAFNAAAVKSFANFWIPEGFSLYSASLLYNCSLVASFDNPKAVAIAFL